MQMISCNLYETIDYRWEKECWIIELLSMYYCSKWIWTWQVVTPTGTTLVENLTLRVEPGSNLLITGMVFIILEQKFLVVEIVIVYAHIQLYPILVSSKLPCSILGISSRSCNITFNDIVNNL